MRVAAYIRVSTDRKDQENSYELQEQYFMQLLSSHAEWQNAGIYADYGISGTGISKRSGFRSLLLHCQEGKIDRIVCKSISRFARNTEDFLTALSFPDNPVISNLSVLFSSVHCNPKVHSLVYEYHETC